jgi:hypothetical protein
MQNGWNMLSPINYNQATQAATVSDDRKRFVSLSAVNVLKAKERWIPRMVPWVLQHRQG